MNDQAIRFRFGIFLLASLILLAVLVILFGGFPSYFKRTDAYTIIFSNANGLAPGTPVKRSGVRIGEVNSVELDNKTGKVQVGIRVDDKYILRKVDRPTLMQSLLGGESSIAFVPPDDPKLQADTTPVEPGSVLQGFIPADASTLEACRALGEGKPAQNEPIAYVCRGRTCSLPIRSARELAKALRA